MTPPVTPGHCDFCGDPIPPKRLHHHPDARFCRDDCRAMWWEIERARLTSEAADARPGQGCPSCLGNFRPIRIPQECCSSKCSNALWRKRQREKNAAAGKGRPKRTKEEPKPQPAPETPPAQQHEPKPAEDPGARLGVWQRRNNVPHCLRCRTATLFFSGLCRACYEIMVLAYYEEQNKPASANGKNDAVKARDWRNRAARARHG